MPEDVPRRYKDRTEFTLDEELAAVQATHRGEPIPRVETSGYKKHRADALRIAGLDDEADEVEAEDEVIALEDQTPAEHLARIQGGRR